MRIQQNRRHGRHVDTIFVLILYLRRQFGVQPMDTFQNQNHVFFQPKLLSTPFPHTFLKIIMRQFHLFTCQQGLQLVVEKRKIQSIKRLEVILSMLVFGRLVTVHEIIVQRHGIGLHAVGHQLYGKPLAERGLPA